MRGPPSGSGTNHDEDDRRTGPSSCGSANPGRSDDGRSGDTPKQSAFDFWRFDKALLERGHYGLGAIPSPQLLVKLGYVSLGG